MSRREIPQPQAGVPYWTAYQEPEGDTRPIDPLAFDLYAERLGNVLLPGITGRTDRVRYLGMVCAGLELTQGRVRSSAGRQQVRERREAFLPFERAWALAVCAAGGGNEIKEVPDDSTRPRLKHEYRGLKGANNVLTYWREEHAAGRSKVVADDYRLLKGQSAQGGLGAYMTTLRTYGFLDPATLSLLEPGRQLASLVIGKDVARVRRLASGDAQGWWMLEQIGHRMTLTKVPSDEGALVRHQLFSSQGPLQRFVEAMPTEAGGARDLMGTLTNSTDSELAGSARFALALDALRQPALEAFGRLGKAATPRGEVRPRDIDAETEEALARTRDAAGALAALSEPPGQEGVRALARRLAETADSRGLIEELLRWHAGHRVPWLALAGDRIILGRHGSFDWPTSFHGFTVWSLLSILEDLEDAV